MSQDYDAQEGYSALKYFHNQALNYSGYGLTWDEFLRAAFGNTQKADIYADGIGLTIRVTDMGAKTVQEIMAGLADAGKGKIPSNPQAYQNALAQKAQNISWMQVALGAAEDVASQTVSATVSFGDNLKTILSTFNGLLPILAIGGGLLFIALKFKRWAK